ncbi:hypothetical protein DAPPUDRAFT_274787, partial [Daphnia pulex]
ALFRIESFDGKVLVPFQLAADPGMDRFGFADLFILVLLFADLAAPFLDPRGNRKMMGQDSVQSSISQWYSGVNSQLYFGFRLHMWNETIQQAVATHLTRVTGKKVRTYQVQSIPFDRVILTRSSDGEEDERYHIIYIRSGELERDLSPEPATIQTASLLIEDSTHGRAT